jgi:anti-sigma B factor antagonist
MNAASESLMSDPSRCPVCGHKVAADPLDASDQAQCSSCGHMSWFRMQDIDDAIMLNLMADMNLETSEIDRVGEFLVQFRTAPRILVNLHNVEFISSTFLNRLIALQKTLHEAQGTLKLRGLNPVIREIFEINKLDGIFDL